MTKSGVKNWSGLPNIAYPSSRAPVWSIRPISSIRYQISYWQRKNRYRGPIICQIYNRCVYYRKSPRPPLKSPRPPLKSPRPPLESPRPPLKSPRPPRGTNPPRPPRKSPLPPPLPPRKSPRPPRPLQGFRSCFRLAKTNEECLFPFHATAIRGQLSINRSISEASP